MKHYGDITKLSGYELPVVDVITGGSPCQDLSVAGKRAGLDGERSGLFMEQIRIVKEMRENDRAAGRTGFNIRPRYMVWENVPGAFSSNKGEDFRVVLEEIAKISDTDAVIPGPPKGKWSKSGAVMGDGWSIAWRVHDAKFWGVPQRRKRIALVADFGGGSAAEILFERKGMRRDIAEGGEERETVADNVGASVKATVCLNDQGGSIMSVSDDVTETLRAEAHGHQPLIFEPGAATRVGGHVYDDGKAATIRSNPGDNQQVVAYAGVSITCPTEHSNPKVGDPCHTLTADSRNYLVNVDEISRPVVFGISSYESNAMRSENPHSGIYEAETARTLDLNGGSPACNQGGMAVVEPIVMVAGFEGNMGAKAGNIGYEEEKAPTLNAGKAMNAICMDVGFFQTTIERTGTLLARQYKDPPVTMQTYQETTGALMASGYDKNGTQEAANDMYITGQAVRRLTPLECERLQGFPDGWTDIGEWTDTKGKKHKEADSPRYKALGNSIAIPFWAYLARRICAQYERSITMASLFDGIGGFPLVFERAGAKAIWASEIEEFPIAVTKKHFPEETKT